jgi:two-component system chemotaxis response regulator CheB
MPPNQINVLIVDDSKTARTLLEHLLRGDPQIRVIGVVGDGQAAIDFLQTQKPDVIVMDFHMPRMDGFEATRRIMETQPVPIIICTATGNPKDVATTFRLLEAGAVACVGKPVAREHPSYASLVSTLLDTIKLMSEVKVVRRWPRLGNANSGSQARPTPSPNTANVSPIIGIGASTGGPPVLQTILAGLPKNFPAPILVVQHIAHGFLPGLVEWLNQTTGCQVHIAAHGMLPLPGHVYFAPDDMHMGLTASHRIFLSREEPIGALRPAVAYLFRTLAETCGARAIGVLLTGMGKDGAEELKLLHDAGGETIAQDRETSVVHGMPGEAIALGAAGRILPPEKIPDALITLVRRQSVIEGISL